MVDEQFIVFYSPWIKKAILPVKRTMYQRKVDVDNYVERRNECVG